MPDNNLTKEQIKLLADRKEWQDQYTYFLNRKNKLAKKLQDAGRQVESSANYGKLKAECQKYWQLLRESLPEYKKLFK